MARRKRKQKRLSGLGDSMGKMTTAKGLGLIALGGAAFYYFIMSRKPSDNKPSERKKAQDAYTAKSSGYTKSLYE